MKKIGGENLHLTQIRHVPEEFNLQLHGYHRKCYQKFTKATSERCSVCQAISRPSLPEPLRMSKIPSSPWERINID